MANVVSEVVLAWTHTTNEASSKVTSPLIDMLALFMATLPAQPVGTAKEAVVPLGIVPGCMGPPTGVGLPGLLVCAVVISLPIASVSNFLHARVADEDRREMVDTHRRN